MQNNSQADTLAKQVVEKMMQEDRFSQWMGIEVIEVREGYSRIRMTIRPEMVNGFGIVHGGVTFAFAFACNNRNDLSVALDTSINFTKQVLVGDQLTAEATELHNGKSTGLYQIAIQNQQQQLVAQFKGLCYRTHKKLI
jgi:acyl-CoA thioesterase